MTTKKQGPTTSKPIAVLISDVHYSTSTLALASAALRAATHRANHLSVPLIVAGDIHDTKANLRGECIATMIDDLKDAVDEGVFVLVGNHDRLNERAPAHALEFLRPYVTLIDEVEFDGKLGLTFFPYFHDPDELRSKLMGLPKGLTLVMHQGVKSAVADGYPFDKTAIDAADVAGMRVISGHYHRRQTIELPDGGKWDYVGNPYTLNFGEASEPEKGFQVLYDDGSLKFVPTNLRKHVVIDRSTEENFAPVDIKNGDLVWLKLHGPADKLARLDKQRIAKAHGIPGPFRLDLIPDKVEATATEQAVATLTQGELLDEMIGSLQVDETTKQRLRPLWKELAK